MVMWWGGGGKGQRHGTVERAAAVCGTGQQSPWVVMAAVAGRRRARGRRGPAQVGPKACAGAGRAGGAAVCAAAAGVCGSVRRGAARGACSAQACNQGIQARAVMLRESAHSAAEQATGTLPGQRKNQPACRHGGKEARFTQNKVAQINAAQNRSTVAPRRATLVTRLRR